MNDLIERGLSELARRGGDPGAEHVWDLAATAAARRRARRRRARLAGAVIVVAIAITVAAVVAARPDRRVHVVTPPTPRALAPSRDAIAVARESTVWTIEPSGGTPLRLTPPGGGDLPAWNPAHTQIAFVHFGDLSIMNADGTHVRDLGQATIFQPAWSPDGNRIAFSASPAGASNGGPLRVIDTDGRGLRTIADVFAGRPSWSPDGREIAFTDLDEPRHVKVVGVATGAIRTLPTVPGSEQYSPSWSPDGRTIAFAAGACIYGTAPNGTALRPIGHCTPTEWSVDEPAWSPDGTSVAFVQNIEGAETLLVTNTRGGKAEPIIVPGAGAAITFDW